MAQHIKNYIKPRRVLIDLLCTIIICILIALFLTITGITNSFIKSLVMSQSFGISTFTIMVLLLWIFTPEKISSYAIIASIGIAGGTLENKGTFGTGK